MPFPESVFRAYDIRGIIGSEITPEFMYNLGRAFVLAFDATEVVVGFDARPSSKEFAPHFCRGVMDQGANVANLGLIPNEVAICYAGTHAIKQSAIITASHNPAEFVGIKLFTDISVQIAAINYQSKLKEVLTNGNFSDVDNKGTSKTVDPWPDYLAHIKKEMGNTTFKARHILADAGNGVGGAISNHLAAPFNLTVDPLFFEPDGTYPNHVPNPVLPPNRTDAEAKAKSGKYDFSVLFDGDADRIAFLDENGKYVWSDIIGTLIADEIIHPKYPNSPVVIDMRRGWITQDSAKIKGYQVIRSISGNPYLKKLMRENDGAYGFEASAHNMYRDFFYSDTSGMTLLYVLQIMEKTGKTLSQLAAPYYGHTYQIPETNYEHHDYPQAFNRLETTYSDGMIEKMDGLTISYPDWHISLRASNTEPLIRLNIETRSQELLDLKLREIDVLIRNSGGKKVDH